MINERSNFSVKKSLFCIFLLALFFWGCKRVVKKDLDEGAVSDDIEEVSKAEYKRVMNLKLPLKTVLINQTLSLTIPENYTFEASKLAQENNLEGTMGKIDFAKIDTNSIYVALNNFFISNENLYAEGVYIIPENDPKRYTIADLTTGSDRIDGIYFEDENSIIYNQSDSFFALNIQYDELNKCFLLYKAEMSWTQKFPKKEKLDLFLHLIKHAKNLTSKNFTAEKFTSWNDYVQSMPVLEIKWVNSMLKKIEKELKFFLATDEDVSPRTPGNYTFLKLYNTSPEKALNFYKNIDLIKANKVKDTERSFSQEVLSLDNQYNYKLAEEAGCYVISTTSTGNFPRSEVDVYCPIDYKGKSFILKTDKEITASDADFFVKMFSHFKSNIH
ncbi:hypothetical protein G6M26_07280 [Agrobacterium tumefaciens]|nr:hypothetical protein [Agrobacterium tumefaciens]NTE18322.1 hypothetical protein [Agrobacterium tumefaciens]